MRYVALGDSYTIGTAVAESERWPNQLAVRLPEIELVANLGVNGYTSRDLIDEELPPLDDLRPEVVSVLIGVNDVVQGVSDSEYAANVAVILDDLLRRLSPARIVSLATPDYTVTPMGGAYGDPVQQSDAIVRFNLILREAAELRDVRFVAEIFEISQGARDDRTLIAEDGLHPSARQYARWTDVIQPIFAELLAR